MICPTEQVSLWNRYKRIHDIIQGPIHPLMVIIGPSATTGQLKKILQDQASIAMS